MLVDQLVSGPCLVSRIREYRLLLVCGKFSVVFLVI